jgi:predicted DNA-binding transcriptional regulator YafY
MLRAVLPTAARLLRLLTLLSSRRSWTGADLAERLETTDRTLRRDVERLRSLGYPVQSTAGTAGGYRLGAGADLPPLLLDDDEAIAVSLGLCTAAGGAVSGLSEAAVRALAKIDQVLPARLRGRVRALSASIVSLEGPGRLVDPEVLCAVAVACRDRERLRFAYRDRAGAPSVRQVEPCGLVHTGRRFYLVAWDLDREAFRTFRLDRVESVIELGPTFPPRDPPDPDLAAYVSRSISADAYTAVARVILHAPLGVMASRVSPAAGVLEAIDDGRCRLITGARSVETLAAWIGMLGVDFEVEEPPALVEQLRIVGERHLRAVEAARQRPGSPAS